MSFPRFSPILGPLILLGGATAAIFVTGTQDVYAVAIFAVAAGLAMFIGCPTVRPGWIPLVLAAVFCALALLAFLPQELFPMPAWRAALAQTGLIPLADSVSPQPWIGWFWWTMLAATCAVGVFQLSVPLEGRALAVFLHAVAMFVAAYAVMSIFAWQTGWKYPFSGGAIFGFLPNKNHTATLLVTGSIIAFGLMQWEVAHGNRGAAVLAALCGAPTLAGLLFFSNSRAGVIFLALGLLLWALGGAQGQTRCNVLVAAGILVGFLLLLSAFGGSVVRDRLVSLYQSAMAVRQAETSDVDFRQPICRDTVRLIKDVPFTGVGLGQFQYVFPQYRWDSARAAKVLHPESDWLQVAGETGIPSAMVLLVLVGWYFVRSWNGRCGSDGMLRWTAASATGAAVAHGLIDVPWHRFALGWFIFVIALAGVPSSGLMLKRPVFARLFFAALGGTLLAGGIFLAWEKYHGRVPAPYRWDVFNKQLEQLGKEKREDEGEDASNEAIRAFPLRHEGYYWLAGYLRLFLDTENEVANATKAGRLVEPVLPRVAADQALLWPNLDPMREAEAWNEAVRRAAKIDAHEGKTQIPSAASYLQQAILSLKGKPEAQQTLLDQFSGDPIMTAYWVRSADAGLVSAWAAGLADPQGWLDALPAGVREGVLGRWIALPDPSVAVAYMEARSGSVPGGYWRQLAGYHANAGDKPRAVAIVAEAVGFPLDTGGRGEGDFGKQLAALEQQGNAVAVRRLLQEVLAANKPDAERLPVAMAWYASSGDWDNAWKAASRLAKETKIRD